MRPAFTTLRNLMVPAGDTVDLTFATKPLLLPAVGSGQFWCLGIDISTLARPTACTTA